MINEKKFQFRKNGKLSAGSYCKNPELIENYDLAVADKEQTWICHHRNERFYSSKELIELGLYYNCPPCELIFVTKKEHEKLYHKGKKVDTSVKTKGRKGSWNGKKHTNEQKEKISKSLKGHKSSFETKQKIANSLKGHISPNKGKHWKLIDGKRVYY